MRSISKKSNLDRLKQRGTTNKQSAVPDTDAEG